MCDLIAVAEIVRFARNLVQIFMRYAKLVAQFLVHNVQITLVQGYNITISIQVRPMEGNSLKSILKWLLM